MYSVTCSNVHGGLENRTRHCCRECWSKQWWHHSTDGGWPPEQHRREGTCQGELSDNIACYQKSLCIWLTLDWLAALLPLFTWTMYYTTWGRVCRCWQLCWVMSHLSSHSPSQRLLKLQQRRDFGYSNQSKDFLIRDAAHPWSKHHAEEVHGIYPLKAPWKHQRQPSKRSGWPYWLFSRQCCFYTAVCMCFSSRARNNRY